RSQPDCELADAKGPELIVQLLSLRKMLDEVTKLHSERDAVVSMHQDGATGISPIRYTFGELHRHAAAFAVALYDHGIRPGQPIVAFIYNCAEFATALWAAARLSVPFVPLDPRMLVNKVETEHCLRIIRPAVILSDCGFTAALQEILNADSLHTPMRIATRCDEAMATNWIPLPGLLEEKDPVTTASTLASIDNSPDDLDGDVAFVVFTSGTSALPKACPHSSRGLWAGSVRTRWLRDIQPGDRLLQHMPNSHVFGYTDMLGFWTAGGTVILPSRSFDAKETLKAIAAEHCTHITAVPTIVQALVSHPDFSSGNLRTLRHVTLGGTGISPEVIRLCQDTTGHGLGAIAAVPLYGMSEGPSILGCASSTTMVFEDDLASVGQPLLGARAKICKPGSQECLAYDEVGELHIGGATIINGYMQSDNGAFYHDDGYHWLVTGDQARMNRSGAVFILGRYKDAQVVGIPDDIAGEVPAAVLSIPDGLRPDTQRIRAAVIQSLGPEYAPDTIITLRDVGLEAFPATTSGKIKKNELRDYLIQHLETQRANTKANSGVSNSTEDVLITVLGHLLGQSPADIPREKAIPELLDSISMLRFLHEMSKPLNKDVTMNHVQGASNLTELAKRIDSDQALDETESVGPPGVSQMSHEPDPNSSKTQQLVQPTLEKLGLTWVDYVQDVYPVAGTASFYMAREMPFSHQLTYATKIPNSQDLRNIIANSLKAWPIFRSFCAEYEPATRLLVVLKNNETFLSLAISEHPDVEDLQELANLSIAPNHTAGHLPDNLSFRAKIARVKSTGTAGFVMIANHATYDFLSMNEWKRDLECLLRGKPMPSRAPFRLFADTYYLYRNSLPAQRSTTFHVRLLDGIGHLQHALWPLQPQAS
ncbi:MAG: hypothetical protein Q9174_005528, partial [Haloplaca sp. 1 TL-2023]